MMQYELDKQHQQHMLRLAEFNRLAEAAQNNQNNNRADANVYSAVIAEVGRQMVNVGQRLQQQYEAETRLNPEISRL
ncbi:MAG: hypothetical protein H7Y09_01945 [Chitinophagaceae bacterium]|nr:hypothetical protein [Anaerolineae bacterium]